MKNYINFLKKIKELKSDIVEFDKFDIMKSKVYPLDCAVEKGNQWLVITIIYNENIFLVNDGVYKAWT